MTDKADWRNPMNMSQEEINNEISKLGPSLKALYWANLARINQLQGELIRKNIFESSRSAATWSKWAISIAAASFLATLGFFVINSYSDKNWQEGQLKTLKQIELNTLKGNK